MRCCLIVLIAALLLTSACGGPRDQAGMDEGSGTDLKPLAKGLKEPAYHNPVGRWRAEHGELVDMTGRASGAGFELGECMLCHQIKGCNDCHAYTGTWRLPREAWQ
jgi:hypothetical protein